MTTLKRSGHFDDCPQHDGDESAECNCRHRFGVVQIRKDGTEFGWGFSSQSDGGRLREAVILHPETKKVMIIDRLSGEQKYIGDSRIGGGA